MYGGGEERVGEGNLGDAAFRPALGVFVGEGEEAICESFGTDGIDGGDKAVGNKPFGGMSNVAGDGA